MKSLASSFVVFLFKLFSLFSLSSLRLLGRAMGRMAWWLNGDSRRVIEENLALCFPEKSAGEREQLTQSRLQHLGMMAFELAFVWQRPAEQVLAKIIAIEGDELVREPLANGQGVIVLAPHIGNWEVLGFYLADQFTVTNMYQPPPTLLWTK
ncbi:lysophospholipid acyltransferase family protein [Oceanicoccus sp. KOV_DT_Chl]|uniref:lysophospholipid acyltransferase family protein n=1 Tax=Oceanicoccus sp. KOV_DT_Chl TaxID=1904639 RepID=UPI000C7E0229|nr:hypothetical protein [Oceanicoccus sp. KOV_DT_Chl]